MFKKIDFTFPLKDIPHLCSKRKSMEIYKFGGTSLGTAERIMRVAGIINTDTRKIVVLSANGKTTDRLVEIIEQLRSGRSEQAESLLHLLKDFYRDLAYELLNDKVLRYNATMAIDDIMTEISSCFNKPYTQVIHDLIITRGEMLSTILFSLYLEEVGIEHAFMPAGDIIPLDDNGQPDSSRIKRNLEDFLDSNANAGTIITQGFICTNPSGNFATLGRGGSDFTASLLGAAADASVIQIWSDVDGFLNNDPKYVRGALPLSHLSFDEAAELAYFGARILHPATINPARMAGIPVLLKNTLRPEAPGTVISDRKISGRLKAVAARDNIWAITIHSNRMLMAYGFLREVFEVFEKYKTPVDMVTTSEVSVSVTIDDPANLSMIIQDLESLGQVTASNGYSILCVVGDHLAENRGKVKQVFSALEEIPVRMISYGAAKNSISILVPSHIKTDALQALNVLIAESFQNHTLHV